MIRASCGVGRASATAPSTGMTRRNDAACQILSCRVLAPDLQRDGLDDRSQVEEDVAHAVVDELVQPVAQGLHLGGVERVGTEQYPQDAASGPAAFDLELDP